MRTPPSYEVIVVGGGPAGLSAALYLGRCRRRVLVYDSGEYRNAPSHAMHGFVTREGIPPEEFRRIAHKELQALDVETRFDIVEKVKREKDGHFRVTTRRGGEETARRIVLGTGLVDELPDVPGMGEIYGTSAFHCPYCDGWEQRDRPFVAYGKGDDRGATFAWQLRQWSKDVVLCTDGPAGVSDLWRRRLENCGVPIHEEKIERFESEAGHLTAVRFEGGRLLARSALFFNVGSRPRSPLAAHVGCTFDERGGVLVDACCARGVEGVYVVGDASRDVLQAIFAAAEGAQAAMTINKHLLEEEAEACASS